MNSNVLPIPYDDFGGSGPPLHFSHANAYTPGCYRQFLEPLARDYHVLAAHHRPLWYLAPGHEQAAPGEGTADWPAAAADLLRFLDQQGLERVIGVGHSLGAVSTMLAARQQPERFSAIVLIDPVFLPPHVLETAAANPDHAPARHGGGNTAPPQPLGQPPGSVRPLPRQAGLRPLLRRSAVGLSQPRPPRRPGQRRGGPQLPAQGRGVLLHQPAAHGLGRTAPLTVPTLAIRATDSDTLYPDAWARWQLLQPTATFVEMDGVGHMVPIEAPVDTAVVVEHWLGDQQGLAQGQS